jgi:hypothetical protein
MRTPVLTLLVLAVFAAPAVAAKPLPRGDDRFQLGMTRPELDLRITERRLEKLSVGRNNLAVGSDDPAVEFERYTILPMKAKDVVAEVTVTYRMPYTRAAFDSVQQQLTTLLGLPSEHLVPGEDPSGIDRESVSWTDGTVLIRLMARWTINPDPQTDRMTVTWSDIQLRQAMLAYQRRQPKPKGH